MKLNILLEELAAKVTYGKAMIKGTGTAVIVRAIKKALGKDSNYKSVSVNRQGPIYKIKIEKKDGKIIDGSITHGTMFKAMKDPNVLRTWLTKKEY